MFWFRRHSCAAALCSTLWGTHCAPKIAISMENFRSLEILDFTSCRLAGEFQAETRQRLFQLPPIWLRAEILLERLLRRHHLLCSDNVATVRLPCHSFSVDIGAILVRVSNPISIKWFPRNWPEPSWALCITLWYSLRDGRRTLAAPIARRQSAWKRIIEQKLKSNTGQLSFYPEQPARSVWSALKGNSIIHLLFYLWRQIIWTK